MVMVAITSDDFFTDGPKSNLCGYRVSLDRTRLRIEGFAAVKLMGRKIFRD